MAFFSFSSWLKAMRSSLVGARRRQPRSAVRPLRSTRLNVELLENRLAPTVSFAPAVTFGAGPDPRTVAIADLNSDGKLDLVTANFNGAGAGGNNTVSVQLGTGTGTFGAATNYTVGNHPISVAIADVNGDGKPDLVVANRYGNNIS